MSDPAYSQLLDTNQELRNELRDEISINKSYEKKICSLVKELEQCYRTISLQDNTIIVHEKEIEKLKSEISDLRKQLRILQQDKKFKDEVGSIQDGRIIELENKVGSLKARIQNLIDKKISINALDMATANLIVNINRGLDQIENHIRGAGTSMQNPANVIDGIRGSLNTIRVTLQNITAERDQYQNLLNETNERERVLIQQLRDMRNENLRSQQLLDESQTQTDRTARERDNAQGERIWLCWPIIMRDKNPVAGCFHIRIKIGVFKDYCEKNLLNSYCISEILTVFSKIPDGCRLMPKTR